MQFSWMQQKFYSARPIETAYSHDTQSKQHGLSIAVAALRPICIPPWHCLINTLFFITLELDKAVYGIWG
jgi:hypothetical protein